MNPKLLSNPYLLAIISGVLLVLSFPPFNLHFLIWIALVPFLFGILNLKQEKSWFTKVSLAGLLLGSVFYYGTLYWIYNIFLNFGLILILVLCVFTVLYAVLLSWLLSKWDNKLFYLFLPAIIWVAIEYVRSEAWALKFSWMSLGYSQHNFLPVLQFASLFGQYGISFLIVLVNSAIVFLIMNRENKKLFRNTFLLIIGLIAFVLLFGAVTLKEKFDPNIKVGLVQDESSEFSVYEILTETLPDDANFIVWPEYSVPKFVEGEPELLAKVKSLTEQKTSYLILGGKDRAIEPFFYDYYNTAFLFDPKGNIIGKYYKMNPIQFFDDGRPGHEFSVFDTVFGKVSILICYDVDYSYVARGLVRNGAEILFIPTYDAMRWSELQHKQHSAMTSMRAVENGRFLARAASSGISQIIDPKGRITTEIDIGESGVAIGYVQALNKKTFYTSFGFLLPYACLIFLAIMVCLVFLRRKAK